MLDSQETPVCLDRHSQAGVWERYEVLRLRNPRQAIYFISISSLEDAQNRTRVIGILGSQLMGVLFTMLYL